MFPMDSKRKGKSWVGNMYNQFEAFCKDFETVIKKENMKSVENQEQSVGVSFYADMVELPHPGANVEHKEKSATGKPVDHMESVTAISTPICLIENQLSADPSRELIADLSLREDNDDIASNDVSNSIEDDMTRNLIPMAANSSSSTLLIANSPALSIHDTGILDTSEETISCNDFLDDPDFNSETNSAGWLFESKLPIFEYSNCNKTELVSPPPVDEAYKAREENSPAMDSTSSSGFDTGSKSLSEDAPLWDDFSIGDESPVVSKTVQSSELLVSYFSCNNEKVEMGVISSSSGSPSEDTTQKAENICNDHAESNCYARTNSTPSPATTAYEIKVADMIPMELEGESHEFGIGFTDADMESVDLTTKVEHDGRSLVPDGNFIHPNFCRRKNLRYYKNLMRDTLTSRKRLSKEYEHLGILYGDIDLESRNNFQPSSSPSYPSTYVNPQRTHSSSMCESEWELL